ncbi:hypothetical protein CDD81_2194 [Ophiocordyceps australis]|uniref:Uncharacterized protein n=1 Tax=Ophiocordyceps australis TaxID=1399860 RepID=A0A2C5XX75_9HYPO|nr:hypothetical protein CDD81_2194 [Ophiocordyceps australis]
MSVYHGGPGWYVTPNTPENARHIHGRPRSDRWADSSPSLDNAVLQPARTERARQSGQSAGDGQSGDRPERTPAQEARARAYMEAAERRMEARETQCCAPYLGQYDEEVERWVRQEEERTMKQKEQQRKREEKERKRKQQRRDQISMQRRQKANSKAMPRRISERRQAFSTKRFFAFFRRLLCLWPEEPDSRGRSPSKPTPDDLSDDSASLVSFARIETRNSLLGNSIVQLDTCEARQR